jgi:2',3'-cyclic-nucleotide 2'-phosphodiesterase (5'-nucleotidase family)
VLPFGNVAVTVDLNGVELKALLEAGLMGAPAEYGGFQQVSGLCLTYDIDLEPGNRVVSATRQLEDGSCNGGAIDFSEGAKYTVISTDFAMAGGDGYPNYSDRMVTLGILDEIVAAYITEVTADGALLPASIEGRTTCQGEACLVPITAP